MSLEVLEFDTRQFGQMLVRVGAALGLAVPIGWEREVSARSAGLRTFPLVAVAACGYVLIALEALGDGAEAHARVLQGLMTGIGFIGGGAILKDKRFVTGTATAASLWATSAIGAAAAYGQLDLALLLCAVTLVVLRLFRIVERRLGTRKDAGEPDES